MGSNYLYPAMHKRSAMFFIYQSFSRSLLQQQVVNMFLEIRQFSEREGELLAILLAGLGYPGIKTVVTNFRCFLTKKSPALYF